MELGRLHLIFRLREYLEGTRQVVEYLTTIDVGEYLHRYRILQVGHFLKSLVSYVHILVKLVRLFSLYFRLELDESLSFLLKAYSLKDFLQITSKLSNIQILQ